MTHTSNPLKNLTQKKTCIQKIDGKIITCPDFYLTENRIPQCRIADQITELCFTCAHPQYDKECIVEVYKQIEKQIEEEAEKRFVENKAKEEARLNRPKILLQCQECKNTIELELEEYTDKRKRRKYENDDGQTTYWCDKCNDFTPQEWKQTNNKNAVHASRVSLGGP